MTDKGPVITFTPTMVKRLKKRYIQAVDNREEEFDFDGHRMLTKYVRYLLIYLEERIYER